MTIDQMIAAAVGGDGGERTVTLPLEFQGLPETAHGGSVLGLFDAIARVEGRRRVSGVYRRRVPLGVPLALSVRQEADGASFGLHDRRGILVDGAVTAVDARGADDGLSPARARGARRPLPVARACLACGLDNPVGLRVELGFDADVVAADYVPREAALSPDGTIAPLAVATLLDEAAFWLGALATGEAGMTTDLAITLHRPRPAGASLVVSGARAATVPLEGDSRYWRTASTISDDAGRLIASAHITFVAVRGAARKLALAMLSVNPRDVVRGVFPAYV